MDVGEVYINKMKAKFHWAWERGGSRKGRGGWYVFHLELVETITEQVKVPGEVKAGRSYFWLEK